MTRAFVEHFLFQVKSDKLTDFESLWAALKPEMVSRAGCTNLTCFKRFYTFDGVELGQPPRELTKIVKCVKYFALWQFDTIENCGKANGWLMENHYKELSKLLIAPYDINSGYEV
ncbi:MAG: hypothetical protein E7319_07665 [Clostridiales bacterium]|nr:hypothetical protein [Clostridiales bacterium]